MPKNEMAAHFDDKTGSVRTTAIQNRLTLSISSGSGAGERDLLGLQRMPQSDTTTATGRTSGMIGQGDGAWKGASAQVCLWPLLVLRIFGSASERSRQRPLQKKCPALVAKTVFVPSRVTLCRRPDRSRAPELIAAMVAAAAGVGQSVPVRGMVPASASRVRAPSPHHRAPGILKTMTLGGIWTACATRSRVLLKRMKRMKADSGGGGLAGMVEV